MVRYGYIENGYLNTKDIEPYVQKITQSDGSVIEQTVSVAAQIAELDLSVWMPVDEIDESKLEPTTVENVVRIVPYVNEGRISFRYEEVFDTYKYRQQIEALKEQLAESDYQVIKCYEANLVGETLPYDIKELHKNRQAIRDNINNLENWYLTKQNV